MKEIEWKAAAKCYDEYLPYSDESTDPTAIALHAAECHELAAYQTDNAESFSSQVELAISICLGVERKFEETTSSSLPLQNAKARRLRLQSFLSVEIAERRELLDEAIRIHRKALDEIERQHGGIPLKSGNFQNSVLFLVVGQHFRYHLLPVITIILNLANQQSY